MLARSVLLPTCLKALPARGFACKVCAAAAPPQPKQRLNNGLEMPLFGLGTWKSKGGALETSVRTALESGYRHIDCASAYSNQDTVGKTFQEVFAEGTVARDDIWVTSKLFNKDHARVREAWPVLKPSIKETWQDMEKLVDDGLVKSIGISNFSVKKTQHLLGYARIKPVANQVELHPYFRNCATADFCQAENILITAYSPLGSNDSEQMFGREGIPKVLDDETVLSIAQDLGWTPAQVLCRWSLQHGYSTIPKSVSPQRIRENLEVVGMELPAKHFDQLNNLEFQIRMLDGNFTTGPNTPYPTINELWDGEVPEENLKRRGLVAA
ncbi:hypothetical protein WJX84_000654 [Apatococcus fuscideae]|uniref:NADP-dependent oxidoreductase domain-containing protein n=1 Tax=Apatococcus fuscideae TaxID=2026836 RepID=A0AAW1TFE8_9CHLO